jgi:ribosomal protein S18 acetylase RimI-like enzyme
VGRSLIAESLRLARECGAGKTWVVTNASNAAAMKLYQATGAVRTASDDVVFVYPGSSGRSSES